MVDLLLYHSNESRAETYNTAVHLYATSYVVFEQVVSTNFTGPAPNVTNMTDNQAVTITVSDARHSPHAGLLLRITTTTTTTLY